MNEKPYNPGLSEKAWDELHSLIARLSIKYADRVEKFESEEVEKETNDNANNRS
ncbi:hypothetical protein ACXFAU_04665 [Paenibacillus glucanolyticus]|uniref:hypothetical protein n=1 Tax=Paenibacillus glucanolyticus TaxID=59843 RepID=UPI0034CDA1D8